MAVPSLETIQYDYLPNGIHRFIFSESTRKTVDEWIVALEDLYDRFDKLHILMDVRDSGTLPIRYLHQRMKNLTDTNPDRPNVRLAAVMEDSIMRGVIDSLMRMLMREDELRYFGSVDEATRWLLDGMSESESSA